LWHQMCIWFSLPSFLSLSLSLSLFPSLPFSSPRVNLSHSYYSSSNNTSTYSNRDLSSTPVHKAPPPPLDSSSLDVNNRSVNIEPKNLLGVSSYLSDLWFVLPFCEGIVLYRKKIIPF
jgi:hypothetical protein